MTKCNICGLKAETYNFKFAIAHYNCTANLDKQKTEKDFARLIVYDVKTIYDIRLMEKNIKCAEKYLKDNGYSIEFINKVINLCKEHTSKFKSNNKIMIAKFKISDILSSFSDAEKNLIIDYLKYK